MESVKDCKKSQTYKKRMDQESSVRKDMPRKERRENKIMYEKLLEKRNNGELGWYIRDGELMRGKQFTREKGKEKTQIVHII